MDHAAHPLTFTLANDHESSRHWDGAGWLRAIVTAVVLFNLVDAVLTVFWVNLGVATEANLLLEGVLQRSAVLFMVVKMSLVSLGMGLLWRQRARPLAVFGIALVFCAYATLFVHHMHVAVVAVVVGVV